MLSQDILMMLFEELGDEGAFDAWVASSGYNAGWSDETIYNALPDYIKEACGDIVMNESWYHGGM